MTHFRISNDREGIQVIDDNGVEHTAQAEPFQVMTRLGKWRPICIRHKLIFKNRQYYNQHWTPVCEQFDYQECPPSDYLRHLKGYTKA